MRTIEELNREIRKESNRFKKENKGKEYFEAINITRKFVAEEYAQNPDYLIYLKSCKMRNGMEKIKNELYQCTAILISMYALMLAPFVGRDIYLETCYNTWRGMMIAIFVLLVAILVVSRIGRYRNGCYSYIFAVAEELEKEEVKKDETCS